MPSKKRKLKVILCTDPMASLAYDNDQDAEYDAIEEDMREALKGFDVRFERNVYPHDLKNNRFDIYLFDFGGMLPGCESTIESHYRELIQQVEDHPNSLFILYSSMSVGWYTQCMEAEAKEVSSQTNVLLYNFDIDLREKISQWVRES